jgi:adenylate cyclase
MVGVQFLLLTLAWTHACIGLYFWLRLKPFFKWAAPFLLAIAVLLPPLAMTGTHRGAHEATERAAQPQWRAEHIKVMPPAQRSAIEEITLFYFPIIYGSAIVLVFFARGARALLESRRGMITVSYPNRKVRVPKGLSILEASLRFNVPHASVCGGRARCSTCRVRIVSDRGALPRPSGREAFVLARVGASANPAIRLACQLRPQTDVAVIPVLPANVGADFVRNRNRVNIGEERYIVSMFVDMRGSTRMAEARLPFDIVFLVNRFLEAASQAVIEPVRWRWFACIVRPRRRSGDRLPAGHASCVDGCLQCRVHESRVRQRIAGADPVWHRYSRRRGHYRRHRLSRSHGVHRAWRRGQRRGPSSGYDKDTELHSRRLGGCLQQRRRRT